jgi:hypothetical protein
MNSVMPIWKYPHENELGAAIIGGYVYRGHTVQSLRGKYVFADVGEGIFTLSHDGLNWSSENIYNVEPSRQFSTFGVDENDELYVVSLFGQIYKFVETPTDVGGRAPAPSMLLAEPNPFTTSTILRFETSVAGAAHIEVYDVRGRRVHTLTAGSGNPRSGAVTWNGKDGAGRDLASGVYFVRLVIDGRVAAHQRVALVR